MDIEFHYYMTYLIATKAGYAPSEAATIAHACQYTDDNQLLYRVVGGREVYENYYSQTVNITRPKKDLVRVYCCFHFLPGDPDSETAVRHDGRMHRLMTTPDSANARDMLGRAISSGDLYRLGIACHVYADTWAHQNFIGIRDRVNGVEGSRLEILPCIGHAEAGHSPDRPALTWEDSRLVETRVDNKARFLDAAGKLFTCLATSQGTSSDEIATSGEGLITDLDAAIGAEDRENRGGGDRIARYVALSKQQTYGGIRIPDYDKDSWGEAALTWTVNPRAYIGQDVRLPATWRDDSGHAQSSWLQFQQAVKAHQAETLAMLDERNLKGVRFEGW